MKCSTIQHENVNRGHSATTIAKNVQNSVPFHGHEPRDVVFIRQLPHWHLSVVAYARSDRTQTLLQLVFQKFQKSFKVIFVYPFVANSFTDLLAPNLQTHRFKKIKCDSLCTDPFPRSASSDVDGCNGNKVSWYSLLSKYINTYLKTEDSL